MKLTVRTLFFIALSAVSFSAAAGPEVRWLEDVHNFGAFNEDDGIAVANFKFVNTGDAPLEIRYARASCGCTTPKYSTTPVAPGDTGTVVVEYDPKGRPGKFSKKVYIDMNTDPERSRLRVEGVVIGSASTIAQRFPADYGSLKLANTAGMFGEITKGSVGTYFLEAYNRSNDTVAPFVDALPPYINVDIKPELVPPGEKTTFIFYLRSDKCPHWGAFTDSVAIHPDRESALAKKFPVVGIINEDFSRLTPGQMAKAPVVRPESDTIDFVSLERSSSEPVGQILRIKNTGKSPLEIRRAYTPDKGVEVSVDKTTLKPGKEAKMSVVVTPSALTGALLNSRITLITNDPTQPVKIIRAVAEIR